MEWLKRSLTSPVFCFFFSAYDLLSQLLINSLSERIENIKLSPALTNLCVCVNSSTCLAHDHNPFKMMN